MTNRKPIYLFVGNDEHPLTSAARQWIDKLVPPAEQAFGLEIVEGRGDSRDDASATIKRCRDALSTPGFLTVQGKVVWWRSVSFLADAQVSATEEVRSELKALTAALESGQAGDSILVVTAPGADKRTSFYKMCSARGEVREFFLPDKPYLVERLGRDKIRAALKEHGLSAGEDVVEFMLARIGADSRQIAMEMEKVALFVSGRSQVTLKDAQAVISSSLNAVMWDLLDAVGERQLPKALSTLRDLLAAKESPIGITVMLMGRIRELLLYREALDKGWLVVHGGRDTVEWGAVPEEVDRVLSSVLKRDPRTLHPFAAAKLCRQARAYSAAALRRNQRILMRTYETLVSSRITESTVLELTLVRLTR